MAALTNDWSLRMTTTKQYDFLNRLTRIESAAGSSNVSVSAYQYNLASQRTALTNADSSYWIYTYDPLGQVTSGKKYWSNGTPVAGQQFEYGFDDIGNRQTAASGGNALGADLREQSYSANLLNQYTSRTVPGYVDVLGKAASAATVTVWGDQSIAKLPLGTVGAVRAERQGDYWRAEVPINNSTGAVWLTVTNWAVLNQGTNADLLSSLTGSVLVAKSPEAFTYDLDGNLTSDSLWTNTCNGENRRVTVESAAGVASAARAREQWTFLPDGRWIERIVSTNNGTAYHAAYTNRYVWDGNVLLAVLDHTNGLQLGFTRGLDLSGTPQGAGGAGGLLFVGYRISAISYHAATFDGNGNVIALVNLSDGTTSAEYAYGPFAEPLQATGPMAKANPLRFSTQYADDVTGDLNYLFRAYTARTGKWSSRDPIGEESFRRFQRAHGTVSPQMWLLLFVSDAPNQEYVFLGNDPHNGVDLLGLAGCCGPDVTAAVNATLSDIGQTYKSWNVFKKLVGCMQLVNLPWAANSWDIDKLVDLGFSSAGFYFLAPARQGTGNCSQTVAYKGKCFNSSAVNYLAYGKMNNLCHTTFPDRIPIPPFGVSYWGLPMTLARVTTWKVIKYKGALLGEALDFTTTGYVGVGPMGSGCTDCSVAPGNVAGDKRLEWRWTPYHP